MEINEKFVTNDAHSDASRGMSASSIYGLVLGAVVRSIVFVASLTAAMVAVWIAKYPTPADVGSLITHQPVGFLQMVALYAFLNLLWGVVYAFLDITFNTITMRYLTRSRRSAIFVAFLILAMIFTAIHYLFFLFPR